MVFSILGALIVLTLLTYVLPLAHHRDKKTYEEMFIAQMLDEQKIELSSLLTATANSFGRRTILTALILLMLAPVAYNKGHFDAQRKIYYEILDTNPRTAIIASYRDQLLVKEYDPLTAKMSDNLQVVNVADLATSKILMFSSPIGPLKY